MYRNSMLSLVTSLGLAAGITTGCDREPTSPMEATVALAVKIPGADHGGRPLATTMTQEVTTAPVYAGDPDGHGEALITLNPGQREVCWDISATNIDLPASASHIHQAAPGVRGGIVVFLTAPDATGRATGCTSPVDLELIKDILRNPEAYYVNVHTFGEFAAGAIRGQLPTLGE